MKLRGTMVFGILILATFCLSTGPALAGKDSLIYAIDSEFATMDRYASTQLFVNNLFFMISDGVVRRNVKTLQREPALAESWKQIDSKTWEFKLREGVKFHNGNELTAECVRFTLMDWILNPKQINPSKTYFNWIKEVKVLDKYTFRIISNDFYPIVLDQMGFLTPYDPAHVKKYGAAVAEIPMGTGPYKFVKWERGSQLQLTANENYWDKGLPYIKNVTFRVIPELSTRIAELKAGGVDLIANVDPDKVGQITTDPNLKIISGPINRTIFYQFDSFGRASKTPVMDVRVRKAIYHAIDREAIMKNMLNGYGEVTDDVCNRFLFGHDKSIKGYEYNPAKAKALLKEAGYEKGFEIDMWQYYDVQNLFNQAAMDWLARVGIKVKLHDYRGNIGALIKLRNSGKITGIGDYSWGTGFVFDAEGILPNWFRKDDPKCYAPDDQIDAWLAEARITEDPAKRKALYVKAQRRILEQVYWMPLFLKYQINAAKKNLQNVPVMPYEYMLLQYAKWAD